MGRRVLFSRITTFIFSNHPDSTNAYINNVNSIKVVVILCKTRIRIRNHLNQWKQWAGAVVACFHGADLVAHQEEVVVVEEAQVGAQVGVQVGAQEEVRVGVQIGVREEDQVEAIGVDDIESEIE